LERQRLDDELGPSIPAPAEDDDDVDRSLAHFSTKPREGASSRKGKVQQIQWDTELEEMSREKAAAEAHWGA